MTERLWHFTCEHGRRGIGTRGEIVPQIEHPLLHCKVSWFTTESRPDREATGLTMRSIRCDRMAYRYLVIDGQKCRPWIGSPERAVAAASVLRDLEEFGDPEHWYIAAEPVRARLS